MLKKDTRVNQGFNLAKKITKKMQNHFTSPLFYLVLKRKKALMLFMQFAELATIA
jgi:hypothetical protein